MCGIKREPCVRTAHGPAVITLAHALPECHRAMLQRCAHTHWMLMHTTRLQLYLAVTWLVRIVPVASKSCAAMLSMLRPPAARPLDAMSMQSGLRRSHEQRTRVRVGWEISQRA